MRKVTFVLLWLCTASFASATTVMFVNDGDVTDGEQVLIDIMTSQGYAVTVAEDLGPNYFQTLDDAKIAELNAVDLVVISHRLAYNQYHDDTEKSEWNALTAPMLNLRTKTQFNTRWDWTSIKTNTTLVATMEAVVPTHPVFAGVGLDENNQVSVDNAQTNFMTTTSTGNGTLLAKEISNGYPWIVTWETGQDYYDSATQGAAGGPRMFLAMPNNDPHDLTADGLLIFANAVYLMSGATFDRAPMVTTGPDGIIYLGDTFQLTGTAYDPEGSVTTTWSLLSGPGNPNISDPAATEPTVTPDAPGTYVMQMSADDGVNPPVAGTTVLYVKDHADDILLAHWTFDEVVDGNSIPDVSGNGFTAMFWPDPDNPAEPANAAEPNFVDGHIDGSMQAIDLTSQEYGFGVLDPYGETDPNFGVLDLGMTIATWVKLSAGNTEDNGRIIAGGNWSLQTKNNGTALRFTAKGTNQFSHVINDGYWHHYVGTFDPVTGLLKFYVDGVKAAEDSVSGIMEENLNGVAIGTSPGGSTPPNAMVDDIQIYNYALSNAQIEALAAEGDRILYVDLGPDIEFLRGADPLVLAATVIDDGDPVATYTWEKVSSAPDPDATVTFTPDDAPTTEVDFSRGGTFVLRLTADDGVAPASDEITVTVINPTCQTALDAGLILPGDIAGPQGADVPDCRVDFYDLAVIAASWVQCNDPEDETCQWPWQ